MAFSFFQKLKKENGDHNDEKNHYLSFIERKQIHTHFTLQTAQTHLRASISISKKICRSFFRICRRNTKCYTHAFIALLTSLLQNNIRNAVFDFGGNKKGKRSRYICVSCISIPFIHIFFRHKL